VGAAIGVPKGGKIQISPILAYQTIRGKGVNLANGRVVSKEIRLGNWGGGDKQSLKRSELGGEGGPAVPLRKRGEKKKNDHNRETWTPGRNNMKSLTWK